MDKLVSFIEVKLAPPLVKISQNRYLDAIQKSFMTYTAYLLISSLFLLISSLPIPGWSNIVAPAVPLFSRMVNGTLGIIGLVMAVLVGYNLGAYYESKDPRVNRISTAVLSLVSFLILFPVTALKDGSIVMNAKYFDSSGIFTALIISIISVEIYRFVVGRNLVIKMPASVPPMIAESFLAIIPAFLTLLFWFFIVILFKVDITGIVDQVFAPILVAGSSAFAQFLGFMMDRVLWFVGIHGSNVVGSVLSPVWTKMLTDNINAFAAGGTAHYLYTNVWIESTVRVSLVPLVILMMMSKVKAHRTLGRMAIIPAIFNIAEPVMFGLPLVLNPILFIPWVLGYAVTFGVSFLFTGVLHLIGPMVATVPWTIPGPIMAYFTSNGNLWAVFVSTLNWVLMFFIWMPFFKVLERNELKKEEANALNENSLQED